MNTAASKIKSYFVRRRADQQSAEATTSAEGTLEAAGDDGRQQSSSSSVQASSKPNPELSGRNMPEEANQHNGTPISTPSPTGGSSRGILRSIFIRRTQRRHEQQGNGAGTGTSEETLKISDSLPISSQSPQNHRHRRPFLSIPCCLLCLILLALVILIVLLTSLKLAKYSQIMVSNGNGTKSIEGNGMETISLEEPLTASQMDGGNGGDNLGPNDAAERMAEEWQIKDEQQAKEYKPRDPANEQQLEMPIGLTLLNVQESMHLGEKKSKNLAFGGGDLLKAAKHGKTDLVRALLDQEAADINETRNGYGNSALHLAATYGHLETVRLLLAKGANVEATNSKGKSPLYYAACEGKEEVVILLIQSAVDVDDGINSGGNDGSTALHCAAEEGFTRIVAILLQNGANVNARNVRGFTPLHWAAKYGKLDVCILLENGADIDARVNSNSLTALHLAAQEGHKHVLELLLDKGADIRRRDIYGWTALHYAIRNGRVGCTKFLLERWEGGISPADSAALFALIEQENTIKMMLMRKVYAKT